METGKRGFYTKYASSKQLSAHNLLSCLGKVVEFGFKKLIPAYQIGA
jgi:hypothetical protein